MRTAGAGKSEDGCRPSGRPCAASPMTPPQARPRSGSPGRCGSIAVSPPTTPNRRWSPVAPRTSTRDFSRNPLDTRPGRGLIKNNYYYLKGQAVPGEAPLRMTRQRRVILDELRKVRSHPTADEVYARVRRRLPHVSLGTVYRNLEVLSTCGVIRKLVLAGRRKRFDGTPDEHCHVRCLCCGRVDDVPGGTSPAAAGRIQRTLGYEIVGCRVEFMGYCPACRQKRRVRGTGARPSRRTR